MLDRGDTIDLGWWLDYPAWSWWLLAVELELLNRLLLNRP